MKRFLHSWIPWVTTALLCGSLLFTACEISGSNDVTRQVSLNVTGSYVNEGGIASRQSGGTITLLAISQRGDQLSAVDNLGARWTGTIGRADGNLATVTLQGMTNTGVEVVISGSIVIEGTTGTLTGTWIEPNLRAPVSAAAAVAPISTPTPNATAVPTENPSATATPTPIPGATATPIPGATPTPVLTVGPPPLPGS